MKLRYLLVIKRNLVFPLIPEVKIFALRVKKLLPSRMQILKYKHLSNYATETMKIIKYDNQYEEKISTAIGIMGRNSAKGYCPRIKSHFIGWVNGLCHVRCNTCE